jgi:response regulator RpfG family c-di-GMP phosphodiesterase
MHWFRSPQFRITAIYVIVGFLWIYFSDRLIQTAFESPDSITAGQNIKGWLFVAVTAGMLYVLVQGHFRSLKKKHRELIESYDQTITGWMEVMDVRHRETRDHTDRVTRMTVAFAREAGITDEDELTTIRRGATLHDVGKIGIPDSVLIKPGKLDEDEWRIIKKHPEIAADILTRIHHLSPCVHIPYCHHEKWDGSGYPQGLRGEEIPLPARLFAIVDVWDALIHDRVYKSAWPEEDVLDHIAAQAGRHFDPKLAELFVRRYEAIRRRAGERDCAPTTAADSSAKQVPRFPLEPPA